MAEEFLAKSPPDPLFPCLAEHQLRRQVRRAFREVQRSRDGDESGFTSILSLRESQREHANAVKAAGARGFEVHWSSFEHYEKARLANERDEFGRCCGNVGYGACANCNCRMLFNQLECVKADLETTKETLNITSVNLDDTMVELGETRIALEECKKERNEEKRKFASAIAKMVQSEMSDVRTQLTALNLCLKDELGEKALEKKAASEAAKAALSASEFITLRLLMF